MGKFISKVKQTVRIEDHLQTKNGIKPAIIRRVQMQDIRNAFEIKRPAT